MKKLFLTFALLFSVISGACALTLEEGYEQISKMPDLKGVETGKFIDVLDGWVGLVPFDNAKGVYKVHEVGAGQTVYYGSKVEEIAHQLPKSELILSGADYSNLIYFYARPTGDKTSELLILIDQAYQGKTTAVIGKVDDRVIEALKKGEVKFTPDHKIRVDVPILICD